MEELKDYVIKKWSETGGLIDKSLGAQILNVTDSRIAQMVKEGKLNEFKIGKKNMLSFVEVISTKKSARKAKLKK